MSLEKIIRLPAKLFYMFLAVIMYMVFCFYVWISKRKIILLVNTTGNLGNVICTYSHVISAAHKCGRTAYLLNSGLYYGYFKPIDDDWLSRFPQQTPLFNKARLLKYFIATISRHSITFLKYIPNTSFFATVMLNAPRDRYDLNSSEFQNLLQNTSLLVLSGYGFRDYQQDKELKPILAEFFSPYDTAQPAITEPINTLRENCQVVIGLVIRHAGYEDYNSGKYFHPLEKYIDLMEKIEHCFADKQIGYFICSDTDQSQEHFKPFAYYFRAQADIENRFSLALCDYIVTVPSSYATLPAFVNDVPFYWIEDINDEPHESKFVKQRFVFDYPASS